MLTDSYSLLSTSYAQAPVFWVSLAAAVGLCIGSFLNVVIYRLPEMMRRGWISECQTLLSEQNIAVEGIAPCPDEQPFDLSRPRSRCPECGHAIRAWENIPVLSYLLLRGRCSGCKSRISARYPAIEALTALISMIVVWRLGIGPEGLLVLGVSWALIALSFIDIDHQLLPDSITLPLLWCGLAANSFGLLTSLHDAVWGALAGYLSLWSVYWGFKLVTGKEGMGYGDFKLLAALGAWMGWQALPVIILLSATSGIAISVLQMTASGRDRHTPIPFGPYLAIAGWIALLWRDDIISAYLRLSGLQ